jgi:hypothetical protein
LHISKWLLQGRESKWPSIPLPSVDADGPTGKGTPNGSSMRPTSAAPLAHRLWGQFGVPLGGRGVVDPAFAHRVEDAFRLNAALREKNSLRRTFLAKCVLRVAQSGRLAKQSRSLRVAT